MKPKILPIMMACALCAPTAAAAETGDGILETASDAAKNILRGWGSAGGFAERALDVDGSIVGVFDADQEADLRNVSVQDNAAVSVNTIQLEASTVGAALIDQEATIRNLSVGRDAQFVANAVAIQDSSVGATLIDQQLDVAGLTIGRDASLTANLAVID